MNKLKEFFYLYKNIIILLLAIIFIVLLLFFYNDNNSVIETDVINNEEKTITKEKEANDTLYVDIKGAVKYPGVYEMNNGSRVIDVIKKAKIKKSGNTKFINLSKQLEDEMVIIIYTNKEINNYLNHKDNGNICNIMINNACLTENTKTINSVNDGTTTKTISANLDISESNNNNLKINNNLVNINTANVDELSTLSGIGKSKANSIILYREENGPFSSISDITKVNGIGTTIYEKIKEHITV